MFYTVCECRVHVELYSHVFQTHFVLTLFFLVAGQGLHDGDSVHCSRCEGVRGPPCHLSQEEHAHDLPSYTLNVCGRLRHHGRILGGPGIFLYFDPPSSTSSSSSM
jgi:hypothetical protein